MSDTLNLYSDIRFPNTLLHLDNPTEANTYKKKVLIKRINGILHYIPVTETLYTSSFYLPLSYQEKNIYNT